MAFYSIWCLADSLQWNRFFMESWEKIAKADRLKFNPYMSINENRNLFKDLGH